MPRFLFHCPLGCEREMHTGKQVAVVRTQPRSITLRCVECGCQYSMTWHQLAKQQNLPESYAAVVRRLAEGADEHRGRSAAPIAEPTGGVVNVRTGAPYDVYIGHRESRHYRLPESKWANPYNPARNATDDERRESIRRYREEHLPSRPDLGAALPELRGKILGCWCAPKACHGDVLVELAES